MIKNTEDALSTMQGKFTSRLVASAFIAFVLLTASQPALASILPKASRTLVGTVTDGHSHPLIEAHVMLEQSRTDSPHSYLTDSQGHYHFRHLKPATDYQVWARYKGHDSSKQWISRYNNDLRLHADLVVAGN